MKERERVKSNSRNYKMKLHSTAIILEAFVLALRSVHFALFVLFVLFVLPGQTQLLLPGHPATSIRAEIMLPRLHNLRFCVEYTVARPSVHLSMRSCSCYRGANLR